MYNLTKRLGSQFHLHTKELILVDKYITYAELVSSLSDMVIEDEDNLHYLWVEIPQQIYVDNNSLNFVCAEEIKDNQVWLYYVMCDKNEYPLNTVRMG